MSYIKERQVLTEILKIYKESPCLWDVSSSTYRDAKKKKTAWDKLLQIYKDWDSDANEATVKKKIDNLKTSYQREARKVKESKQRTDLSPREFHRPNLWYFELLTFLDKKNESNKPAVDSIISENEDEPQIQATKRKRMSKQCNLESKQEKLIDTALALLKTDTTATNPFGLYVGAKMEEIAPGLQRHVAEKLICDVIFLAKINKLTFDSKIDIPSRTRHNSSEHFDQYNLYVKQSPSLSNEISQSPHGSSDISLNSPCYEYNHIQTPPPASDAKHPPQISIPTTSPTLHSIQIESRPSSSHSHSNEPLLLAYLKNKPTTGQPEFAENELSPQNLATI